MYLVSVENLLKGSVSRSVVHDMNEALEFAREALRRNFYHRISIEYVSEE